MIEIFKSNNFFVFYAPGSKKLKLKLDTKLTYWHRVHSISQCWSFYERYTTNYNLSPGAALCAYKWVDNLKLAVAKKKLSLTMPLF